MKQDMQRCPHCSAYVMSSDDFCPRCDHRLDRSPDSTDPGGEIDPITEIALPAVNSDADPTTEIALGVEPVKEVPVGPPDPGDDLNLADRITDVIDVVALAANDRGTESDTESENAEGEVAAEMQRPPEGRSIEEAGEVEAFPESAENGARAPRAAKQWPTARPIFAGPESDTTLDAAPTAEDNEIGEVSVYVTDAESDLISDPMDLTHPAIRLQSGRYIVPPAPYTPPPFPPTYAAPQVAPPPAHPARAFLQQRVDDYRHGGYRLRSHYPDEAVLSCGKRLGVGGWFLAIVSIIGALWYVLLLALSGFQRDSVYIMLESDGYVYEDGPGAAHVRRQRSRVGRRWAAFGLLIFIVCLLLAAVLGIVAGIVLTQDRYQAALREAYPAVTLFEEQFSATEATPDDVRVAKDGAVAFSILAGIAAVGLWGGATLVLIGTIHASAYQVHVNPLPGW